MIRRTSFVLSVVLGLLLAAPLATAQLAEASKEPNTSVPTTSPEPLTLAALAGGAAVAGGVFLRRKKRSA